MRRNPKKSFISCLLLIMVLYLILLVWILPGLVGGALFEFLKLDAPLVDPVILLYAVTTIVTIAWLQDTFAHTKVGRDSEQRLIGFFGILFIVPHVIIVAALVVDFFRSLCL